LLIRSRGEEAVLGFTKTLRLSPEMNRELAKQIAVAREIVAKYGERP